jgi:CRISPR-associated protein Csx17
MKEWDSLLKPLESRAEFRIARAISSLLGRQKQNDEHYSSVEPMLGSILPLKLGHSGWFLPGKGEGTQQNVWSGSELVADLTQVLKKRYIDSLTDDRPALRATDGAPLADIIAFLRNELDDHLIARWTEAMSLIGWKFTHAEQTEHAEEEEDFIGLEPAYAALRSLLELECEWQGQDPSKWKKRRSQQPISLLCQRSAPALWQAVSEALRWISIWGVRNPWGTEARLEKPVITGRYIINPPQTNVSSYQDQAIVDRIAATVLIPIRWQDRWKVYRAVTLPPGN